MPAATIVDADSHVTEAPDLWLERMSKKWGDLVPRVRFDEKSGRDCWFAGDRNFGPIANTAAVRIDEETGAVKHVVARLDDAVGVAQMHPSAYDAKERLKVLDDRGIQAQVLYPNMNFVGEELHDVVDDPAYKLENIRAYNDWLVEWASEAPDRLLPIALVPFFDVKEAAAEVLRAKELGHRGIAMTGKPQLHGQPFLADRHWDPLWSAAQEVGIPVNIHLGAGPEGAGGVFQADRLAAEGGMAGAGPRIATDLFLDNAMSFCDFLNSGVLPRFPELKVVSVEGGMGWANFVLESLDFHFKRFETLKSKPEFEELPSFYFRRQCYVTYWFEQLNPLHVETLGERNIMFETDFPHSTSLTPPEMAWAIDVGLSRVSEAVKERVLGRNAAELYGVELPETGAAV
jgi:predicted TIM-barrel fold metal-dependent hydrolase